MSTSLIWFRNDLRVHDNQALYEASNANVVVPVYCFDPRHFKITDYGFHKTGSHRTRFLTESVQNLRENLIKLKGDLIVRKGKPEEILPLLIDEFGVDTLCYHTEEGWEEKKTEQKVLEQIDIKHRTFHGRNLFHPDDIPYDVGQIPDTFTSFRKRVEKKCDVRECFPNPGEISLPEDIERGEIPTPEELCGNTIEIDDRSVLDFEGGERAAARRLKHYFWQSDELKNYKFKRNGLLGADYSSKFSPWLANGCLSPRKVYWQVKKYESERKSNVSTYWLIFELIWRDYFYYSYLRHGTEYFMPGGIQGEERSWRTDRQAFQKWAEGSTGIPFIDANMRELNSTGFMSNRGRQNVASFLSQNLELDWRMGAEYFESMLVDYDVYSNYGNWMYNSTVGHDSRNRYFNIVGQAKKYDENGEYVRHWLPELKEVPDDFIHEPHTMSAEEQQACGVNIGESYPEPMIDLEASYERIRKKRQ